MCGVRCQAVGPLYMCFSVAFKLHIVMWQNLSEYYNSANVKRCVSACECPCVHSPPITTQRRDALSVCAGVPIRQELTSDAIQTTMKGPKVSYKILACGSLRWKSTICRRCSLSVSITITSLLSCHYVVMLMTNVSYSRV